MWVAPGAEAADALGAHAFATGEDVAFRDYPDLHTAAHEAAHVVQQRGGLQLDNGVGRRGDTYERQADQVADAVVRGQSAEAMLDNVAGSASHSRTSSAQVQLQSRVGIIDNSQVGRPPPDGLELPAADDPQVSIIDNDTGECRRTLRSEVVDSPFFVDNGLVKVTPRGDPWTLTVERLLFTRASGDTIEVPWSDIAFEGGQLSDSFEQAGGFLFPLMSGLADRAFDRYNTPNIVEAAGLVFEVVAELKSQRVEYADLTAMFAANIASLGGVHQLIQTFTQKPGVVTWRRPSTRRARVSAEEGPAGSPPEKQQSDAPEAVGKDEKQAPPSVSDQTPHRSSSSRAQPSNAPTLQPGETYYAHHGGGDSSGLMAHLDEGGMLNLYIKTRDSTPRGGAMFREAMQAFGSENVKGVRGTWLGTGDMRQNFDDFKVGIQTNPNLSPEEVALHKTFTGHMSKTFGFTHVRIVKNTETKVIVEFTR